MTSESESDILAFAVPAKEKKGSKKRLSVERIYQKKTQLEHILLRPDTYIGSVEPVTQVLYLNVSICLCFLSVVLALRHEIHHLFSNLIPEFLSALFFDSVAHFDWLLLSCIVQGVLRVWVHGEKLNKTISVTGSIVK